MNHLPSDENAISVGLLKPDKISFASKPEGKEISPAAATGSPTSKFEMSITTREIIIENLIEASRFFKVIS